METREFGGSFVTR